MNLNVVLSIDSECKSNPTLLNLDKNIYSQEWLKVFSNANELRDYICSSKEKLEVWIVSNDNIEAINLAAAIKQDRPDCLVCLISEDISGSLKSRADAASIDSIIGFLSLNERISIRSRQNYVKQNNNNKNLDGFAINEIPKNNILSDNNKAFTLSVVSATGGSGKSVISVMLATLSQTAGLKTLLIDADLQFGNCASMLEGCNAIQIDKYLANKNLISKLKPKNNCPAVLSPPKFPEYAEKITNEFLGVLELVKPNFDVIIVNTGNYWNDLQAVLLEKDSASLFILDQNPNSINVTKKALSLCSRCGIATGSILYTINRCSKQAIFRSVDISCALNGSKVAEILDGGFDVDEAMSIGKPIELIRSRNTFAVSLWSIFESLFPKDRWENKCDLLDNYVNRKRPSVKNKKIGF